MGQLRRTSTSNCPALKVTGDEVLTRMVSKLLESPGLTHKEHDQICGRIRAINKHFLENDQAKLGSSIQAFKRYADEDLLTTVSLRESDAYVRAKVGKICPGLNLHENDRAALSMFPFDSMTEEEARDFCSMLKVAQEDGHTPNISSFQRSMEDRQEFERLTILATSHKGNQCDSSTPYMKLVEGWADRDKAESVSSDWPRYNDYERSVLCEIWTKYHQSPSLATTYIYMLSRVYDARASKEAIENFGRKFNTIISLCGMDVHRLNAAFFGMEETLIELEKIAQRGPINEEKTQLCKLAQSPYHDADDRGSLTSRINLRKNEWPADRWQSSIERKCAENEMFIQLGDYPWFENYLKDMITRADIRRMCGILDGYTRNYHTFDEYQRPSRDLYKRLADDHLSYVTKRRHDAKALATSAAAAAAARNVHIESSHNSPSPVDESTPPKREAPAVGVTEQRPAQMMRREKATRFDEPLEQQPKSSPRHHSAIRERLGKMYQRAMKGLGWKN